MLDIHIGAIVANNEEEIGRIECIVLERDSYEATHLVVRQGRALSSRHILMPVGWVAGSADRDHIRISRLAEEIAKLPNFELQHYVRLDMLDEEHEEHPRSKVKPADWINYFVPLIANAFGDPLHTSGVVVTDQLLGPSESAIRRGLHVESCDGHRLGEVQEVLLAEPDWGLSGIIITRGFVLKHPMRVPADWVSKIERERIVLNRSKKQVEAWERTKR